MIAYQQVSKRFGGQVVLDAVDCRILDRERVGIVGPNGAGKSTLFALISGDMEPDAGSIVRDGGLRIGYLRQQLPAADGALPLRTYVERAAPDLHAMQAEMHRLEDELQRDAEPAAHERALRRLGDLQTAFEHRGGYDLHARAAAALTGLGFSPAELDRPLDTFSGGWQMRAELARALVADPDVLLLDEPTNYLDLPAVEWLRRFLADYRGTLAMISHDRYLLRALAETILEVYGGRVTRYPCTYDGYLRERVLRREQAESARANLDRRRAQIERFVERFRSKNTKATQVQSRIKMLEKMETVDLPDLARSTGTIRLAAPPHCGREVVRLDGAGFSYDGERWVLRNIDLAIQRGEKLAVVGWNGTGKTTLLRLLAGQLEPGEGRRVLGHKVVTGYQSQEFADTMDAARTAFEILKAVAPDASEQEIRTLLGGFGFSGEAAAKTVGVLSGGEKIRLAFARLLIRPPNLLLLDEPTTHLDIESREALQDVLRTYEGTLALVSHDVEFVRAVAEGILAVTPAGVTRYAGGYDYYREKVAQEAGAAGGGPTAAEKPGHQGKADRRERAERRRELREATRELDRLVARTERRIEKLETERAALHERLADPDLPAADRAEAGRRLKAVEDELDAAMQAWEEACTRRDETLASLQGG